MNDKGIPKSYLSPNCNEIHVHILKIKTKFAIHSDFYYQLLKTYCVPTILTGTKKTFLAGEKK